MILDLATKFGPATCGCVPGFYWRISWCENTLIQKEPDNFRGWPRCPICHGTGVDPRIPV